MKYLIILLPLLLTTCTSETPLEKSRRLRTAYAKCVKQRVDTGEDREKAEEKCKFIIHYEDSF